MGKVMKAVVTDSLTNEELEDDSYIEHQVSLDGVNFTLYLGKKSQERYDKLVEELTANEAPEKAEPFRPKFTRSTTRQAPKADREQLDAVRAWARENGFQVADRGRIAASIMEAYNSAN